MKRLSALAIFSGSRQLIQIVKACGEAFSLALLIETRSFTCKMNISTTKRAAALPQPSLLTA